ncbi:glyoxalase superfamily protein, partial [Devosia limi]|uniref:glyoxalase superfamily protein n=1 Tax=Devosia limi TaxID=288995 RepID=UPI000A9812E5
VQTVPILRSFSEATASEFLLVFLGFQIDSAHRFEPSLPLDLHVSRNGIALLISYHHGEAQPASALRIGLPGC